MLLDLIEMLEAQQHMAIASVPPIEEAPAAVARRQALNLRSKSSQLKVCPCQPLALGRQQRL